ncbi:hypothetical protein BD780_003162 [Clostridium tetanomorphum]|uniref:Uncharacterized protein n=1 Tax=Clostridium tetanomorphum TaxID=1553 RepID=A0A923ED63_CLOTT|nr:hypothetical protein [Clostridium tetanomorphum]MBC2399844.1 hypothetical protein [Clostridium tetanomorphum]MBP1866009.1 hypothetical protein [Clostridium tetanomorphum]NRS85937.1 hypothetical protein [Clostridium tetanomorphum]NRZ96053.1 hypothetical protein [Clostridium tetanomorphum]SQB89840.1 membrane protein [Clostridium tetanomorphum]
MSRRYCPTRGSGNGLLILILIVLQFNCFNNRCNDHSHDNKCIIDNSLLFIIALYFLCCCGNFNLCCGGYDYGRCRY